MKCKYYKSCPLRDLENKKIIGDHWRKNYCQSENNFKNCLRYKMEKENKFHPDNMMPDGSFVSIKNEK